MKRILFILIVVLILCTFGFSETTVVRESSGSGATRDDAIKNGLYNAVAETQGVKIGSGDYRFGFHSATADIDTDKDESKKKVEFDAVSVETEGSALKTYVEGLVQKYEVIEETKEDDGGYTVKLKVWLLDYTPLENINRIRLAVMPLRASKQQYIFGIPTQAEDIAELLSHGLTNNLTATNKFLVLDREYDDEHFKEQFLLAKNAPIEEQIKLNETLGADYVLVGTISDALLVKSKKEIAAIGRKANEYKGRFVFDYRVVAGPTRSVKFSDTVELVLETEDVKALFDVWEPSKLDIKEVGDKIVAKVSKLAAEAITQDFYPIKVVKVTSNGRLIIDRGNGRVEKGQILDVYAQAEKIMDADTGESLGSTQVKLATIEIQHVLPKMAQAIVIEGDLSKISQGNICKYKQAQEILQGRKSDIEKTGTGGVKMPFDK
ncbi:MAG: hypothetical protein JW804_05555 [Sedimentisphaerales bacterium]|nr:hypothetical protein [Sedimentisphaerales bacterium]